MSRPVIALDVDLQAIYAYCSECGVVADEHEYLSAVKMHVEGHAQDKPLVLCEIAGAVDYSDNKAIAHNKRRWTIWNVSTITELNEFCKKFKVELLVSPSSKWTHGHDSKVRHALVKAQAKNHDLREAESMIWFYRQSPADWTSLRDFLEQI